MSINTFLISSDTTDLNYPEVRPTLDLNFARVKALDPRITFTRSSGGSYVGADGLIKLAGVNEARFDHDPYTGESLGFLVEESRTNLITPSNIGNTSLNDGGVTLSTDTTIPTPLGNFSGVLKCIHRTSAPGYFRQGQNIFFTAGVTYTFSFFFKNETVVSPYGNNPNTFGITVTTFSPTFQSLEVSLNKNIPYPNGWYRQVSTFTPSYTQTYQVTFNQIINQPLIGTYYLYGFQLEQGAFPTSYIPTVASTVTRAADVASITGANFSSWYRQDEGTILITQRNDPADLIGTVLEIGGTTGNYALGHTAHNIGFANATTLDIRSYFFGFGTPSGFFYGNRTSPGTIAYAYKQSNYGLSTGGNNVPINKGPWNQLVQPVPVVDSYLGLGMVRSGASTTQLHISRLTYWPKRLPDAQLQVLTR